MDGEKLDPFHIAGTMALLLLAGIDTTWSAIGSSLWHLASTPADRERLVAEPDLLPTAMEELLRAYAPVTMARLVKEDMDWNGCPMKADDWILLSFPAANRDPELFERRRPGASSTARSTATRRSGWACTAASGRTSPGWRCGWRSRRGSPASPSSRWPTPTRSPGRRAGARPPPPPGRHRPLTG